MCGIAGLVHLDPRGLADAGEVARMTRTLVHRGPDGEGVWTKGAVGFGHRRLAILDLSEAGAQPMADRQGEITVTYNGEVYNWRDLRRELEGLGHSFHTECDTEVLVEGWRAWGVGLLDRLEGMYAFAVHDGRTGQVLLARDRLGIKPLYWAEVDGTVLFASEVRALLASGRLTAAPDRERVDAFLTLGYVPGERTFFEGIRKLRPGHALLVEGGAVRTWRTWDPARIQPVELPYAEARAELDRRFTATLERHLMSDVPLGCFLSGGVDSSGVVAWLADDLLLKADKMTMAASIELRVPFLDHGLVEFGLGLPREFKVQGGVGKRILKDLFSELVPRDLLYRTKQGFPVPVSRWFREGLRDRVEGLLTSERCLDRGYLRPEYVRGVLQRHASGREDLGRRLFALVVLELWHRRWIDGETHPARALSA